MHETKNGIYLNPVSAPDEMLIKDKKAKAPCFDSIIGVSDRTI